MHSSTFRKNQPFRWVQFSVYIVFPPSIKSTKMVIFGPKCIEKSKMSKIIGKTQKSHHDVIVTSLWRHKAVFRTCVHSFAISFLLIWWSSNYISDIVILSNSILKVFETMRRLDVIWRQKTSKYSFVAFYHAECEKFCTKLFLNASP